MPEHPIAIFIGAGQSKASGRKHYNAAWLVFEEGKAPYTLYQKTLPARTSKERAYVEAALSAYKSLKPESLEKEIVIYTPHAFSKNQFLQLFPKPSLSKDEREKHLADLAENLENIARLVGEAENKKDRADRILRNARKEPQNIREGYRQDYKLAEASYKALEEEHRDSLALRSALRKTRAELEVIIKEHERQKALLSHVLEDHGTLKNGAAWLKRLSLNTDGNRAEAIELALKETQTDIKKVGGWKKRLIQDVEKALPEKIARAQKTLGAAEDAVLFPVPSLENLEICHAPDQTVTQFLNLACEAKDDLADYHLKYTSSSKIIKNFTMIMEPELGPQKPSHKTKKEKQKAQSEKAKARANGEKTSGKPEPRPRSPEKQKKIEEKLMQQQQQIDQNPEPETRRFFDLYVSALSSDETGKSQARFQIYENGVQINRYNFQRLSSAFMSDHLHLAATVFGLEAIKKESSVFNVNIYTPSSFVTTLISELKKEKNLDRKALGDKSAIKLEMSILKDNYPGYKGARSYSKFLNKIRDLVVSDNRIIDACEVDENTPQFEPAEYRNQSSEILEEKAKDTRPPAKHMHKVTIIFRDVSLENVHAGYQCLTVQPDGKTKSEIIGRDNPKRGRLKVEFNAEQHSKPVFGFEARMQAVRSLLNGAFVEPGDLVYIQTDDPQMLNTADIPVSSDSSGAEKIWGDLKNLYRIHVLEADKDGYDYEEAEDALKFGF